MDTDTKSLYISDFYNTEPQGMYMKLCIIELSIHWYQTLVSLIHLQFMKIKR